MLDLGSDLAPLPTNFLPRRFFLNFFIFIHPHPFDAPVVYEYRYTQSEACLSLILSPSELKPIKD